MASSTKRRVATKPKVTPDQRAAQRQLIGLLNFAHTVDLKGIHLHRDDGLMAAFALAQTAEVRRSLELLGIGYDLTPVQPRSRGVGPAYDIAFTWKYIDELARWAPSAVKDAVAIREQMPMNASEAEVAAQWLVHEYLCDGVEVDFNGNMRFEVGGNAQENPELLHALSEALEKLGATHDIGMLKKPTPRFIISVPVANAQELARWFPQYDLTVG